MIDALMWGLTVVGLPALILAAFVLPRRAAVFLLLTMAAAGILAVEIQFITLRPRPEGPFQVGAFFPSFPSGHAAIAFAWATFLALIRKWAVPALLFATMIAVSRVYLHHHHASDVLLGAALGAATAAISYGAFYQPSQSTRPHWAWWLWPQLALCLFAGADAYLGLTDFDFLRIPMMDKALHFALFGALAFFLAAWSRSRVAIVALGAIATLDEAMQALSPGRSFDPIDL